MDLISLLLMAAQIAPAQAAPTPTQDKIMCRTIQEPQSRIPSRICRKQSEWQQMERETQDELRSSRNQRTTGGPES